MAGHRLWLAWLAHQGQQYQAPQERFQAHRKEALTEEALVAQAQTQAVAQPEVMAGLDILLLRSFINESTYFTVGTKRNWIPCCMGPQRRN
jgi:hypothetical protein